jgi:hypothetical protein
MDSENINKRNVAEPLAVYNEEKPQQGKGKDFDFDKSFAKGLTIDEAKKLSKSLIEGWWKK